jgi:ribosomal 50S subunit-recycling heat shock protein
MRLAAWLLIMPRGAVAQQAVTAGQLMANGFEVRASYMVEKGTPVLVLQKGADAYLCSPLQGGQASRPNPAFRFAHAGYRFSSPPGFDPVVHSDSPYGLPDQVRQ